MSFLGATSERRFYRDADRAVLGGVCAGLAGYLGFNLKMTRCLAFIAFLMAMPIVVTGYIAAVFLIPSSPGGYYDRAAENAFVQREERRRKTDRAQRTSLMADTVRRRCQSVDERLARLERHVTTSRFQLEQELRRL